MRSGSERNRRWLANLRRKVFDRAKGRCEYCQLQLTPETATLDHYVARSKGGSNGIGNMRLSCFACNNLKGNMSPAKWLARCQGVTS